ncbi:phage tail protein [Clostridioides difficile]|uniref:phage tail protein n=4 Tax=Clostridioides difficile TaxID=1496 RepID=UPI00038C8DC5|nr:phage tail protein [Clostridioides difficile]EGT3770810.1 phage tail protein [Clostridioides difficile]EGT3803277.1 phage tail protein [Clostridioides difficile]EGT3880599.1 phage tail protein [Clostridioides difficile]EGT4067431.1 phage tail protein [Clostridioides difficile]EGT4074478.1 phage tail protein [Clostridioides difficile]
MAIDKSYYTIITDVGKAKIANASVTGNKVGFVKIQLGDGGGSEYTPTESQTALKNVVWEGNIGNTTTDETAPNCIILESLIPSSVGGFMIREIGYLDDENNLIAISKYKECYKPSIEQGAVVDMKVKTVLIVSNVNNIELKIDPTIIFATLKDIQDLETKIGTVNTKIDTTKTELTSNIETAKTELNTKIDQLIAGGSNVAYTQRVAIDDWVEDAESGFKATVTHSLLTQRIVVNIIDATTKENVVTNFKIIDDNSIEIRSEARSELNVYVINGNAETHFINATVDDNRVSEMTTYSSKKIEDSISSIQLIDTSISITDANDRFTSDKLDGVLEEIMVEISGQRTKGITIVNNLIDMI